MISGLSHVIEDRSVGLHRAAAIGTDGRVWHLFLQAFGGRQERVRAAQFVEARVRALEAGRGVFLDHIGWKLWSGGYEPLFCDRRHGEGLKEGQTVKVRVESAGRQDHVARVRPVAESVDLTVPEQSFQAWLDRLGLSKVLEACSEQLEQLDEAFEACLRQTVPLLGGGAIHIERTRALTAIDVDAGDRAAKGSAGAQALSLNREAVAEAARQICMRGLGGAVVIDCVSPLNEAGREKIRSTLVETFSKHDERRIDVLKPSKFGLVEAAIPWRDAPLEERLAEADIGLLLKIKAAERQVAQDRGGFYELRLDGALYEAYVARKRFLDKALQECLFGRLKLSKASVKQEGLRRL